MSEVTNVILKTAAGDDREGNPYALNALNLACCKGMAPFEEARFYVAGDKFLEVSIYLGAFNHLDLQALRMGIESASWDYPDAVQLFIQEDNEERFHEVTLWERKG